MPVCSKGIGFQVRKAISDMTSYQNPEPRPEPRISVASLGEYLAASPSKRRAILTKQKKPSDIILIYWQEAQEAITEYFVVPPVDGFFDPFFQQLQSKAMVADKTQTKTRYQWNSRAITSFINHGITHGEGWVYSRLPKNFSGYVNLGKTSVSIRPELLVQHGSKYGFVKFLFKNPDKNLINDRSRESVASLLHRYGTENPLDNATLDRKLCRVVDVFQGSVTEAPKNYISRLKDVEAACQEISAQWPSL